MKPWVLACLTLTSSLASGAFAQSSPFVPQAPSAAPKPSLAPLPTVPVPTVPVPGVPAAPATTAPGTTAPAASPPPTASPMATPTPPAPTAPATPAAIPTVPLSAPPLPAPRIARGDGRSRVVFDLPPAAKFTLIPTFTGMRIDFTGVRSDVRELKNLTADLLGWRYAPAPGGVTVTLSTPFSLGLKDGWTALELPADGATARRLVIDLGATLTGGPSAALAPLVQAVAPAAPAATTPTVTPPAVTPSVAAPPTAPASPPIATPDGTLPPLGLPRFGKTAGNTRVVFDLPAGATSVVAPTLGGLRVDLRGVAAVPATGAVNSPELIDWRYDPAADGVAVTLRTPYVIGGRGGFKTLLLPPDDAFPQARLVIDLSPALADTSPLAPEDAALPRFPAPVRVVLDPGHGGVDPGAVGSIVEKNVTLDVARRVRALLQAAGAEVVMTRDGDTQLSVDKNTDLRARAAFGAPPAQVLVSVHVNAMDPATVLRGYGIETWWYPNTAGSPELATALQGSMIAFTGAASKGLKSTSLAVLRGARVPAALVEIGFTSHPVDGLNLLSPNYLDRVAAGIARGISNFLLGAGGAKK